ncbi:MAG TPA: stage V sporulation protein G [Planctomycetes bacterium]|nr:stage V sporulation protein G [Planctomycetota bacterium]
MQITDVQVRLLETGRGKGKLRGYCTLVLDDAFVVRDLKIIEGTDGVFVAMPARRLTARCPHRGCHAKNHLRAAYCNDCGRALPKRDVPRGADGRMRLHVDLAHPIHREARRLIHQMVVAAYEKELEASRKQGYVFAPCEDVDRDPPALREEVSDHGA